jgi:GTPase SAR1 family protein
MTDSQETAFGRILVLGLQAVGKTSLLLRIQNLSFSNNIKPTLGMQVYKIAIENTNFIVYDLGGQKKLRDAWFNLALNPDGIIYCVDCNAPPEQFLEDHHELNRVINFFFKDKEPRNFPPVLILGNKIDKMTEYKYILPNVFYDIKKIIDFHFGYCSALKNEGILENLKWLIGEIIKRSP